MMGGQARGSGLVMGLDTHMIAGGRACAIATRPTHPIITTNHSSPHFDETVLLRRLGHSDQARGMYLAAFHRAFAAVRPPDKGDPFTIVHNLI
jgi:hypothetical protein